jgi:glucose-1-phosphate adenylyltransferase
MKDVLTVILAGGRGSRLEPLTRDRAKPAVPFGGQYRIIDFTLSNCINSNLRRVLVMTQYKARSLDRHIRQGWSFLSPELGESIEVLPPQQRIAEHWYGGTADAIYQNIYSIEKEERPYTLVLAGDHIYKMDYSDMIRTHIERNADLTIGCIPIPLSECRHFGIMEIDADFRVCGFDEKPAQTHSMPGDLEHCLGSMGIYVFNSRSMFELLLDDAADPKSQHDFGKNIIPSIINTHRVFAHPFQDRNRKKEPYWRDVGTLDAFYQANMDLVEITPVLNLYDQEWPIRTFQAQFPPPKFVFHSDGPPGMARRGEAIESMVSPGCIISGGHVRRSILSPNVRVNSYAIVENSILFEGVNIGRHCHIRRAIIDKDVQIPAGTHIGFDRDLDQRRGFTFSDQGVVVIPKGVRPEVFTHPPG